MRTHEQARADPTYADFEDAFVAGYRRAIIELHAEVFDKARAAEHGQATATTSRERGEQVGLATLYTKVHDLLATLDREFTLGTNGNGAGS
jgi:hypothetical protein